MLELSLPPWSIATLGVPVRVSSFDAMRTTIVVRATGSYGFLRLRFLVFLGLNAAVSAMSSKDQSTRTRGEFGREFLPAEYGIDVGKLRHRRPVSCKARQNVVVG